jgi:hypothetical protein
MCPQYSGLKPENPPLPFHGLRGIPYRRWTGHCYRRKEEAHPEGRSNLKGTGSLAAHTSPAPGESQGKPVRGELDVEVYAAAVASFTTPIG